MTEDDADPLDLKRLDEENGPAPERPLPAAAPAKPKPAGKRPRQTRVKFSRQDLTRHVATCKTCGATNDKRNAQAWASLHVNSNGGHVVALVLESVVADRDLDEAERLAILDAQTPIGNRPGRVDCLDCAKLDGQPICVENCAPGVTAGKDKP